MGGYRHLATGDWSLVFQAPCRDLVLKISPYDPSYLLFARVCMVNRHKNLPQVHEIGQLERSGFFVTMPRYTPVAAEQGPHFLASLKAAVDSPLDADPELSKLIQILSRGLLMCADIPYFSGIDWNPANVLLNGATPKFIDAFNVSGSSIMELLNQGKPVTTTIYLLRHASTTPSPDCAPEFDWSLNERGRLQAEHLISPLGQLDIDGVFCSSQKRMVETVMPYCRSVDTRPELIEGLQESRFQQGWVEDFEDHVKKHWANIGYHQPGCESHLASQRRFVGCLLQLARGHAGQSLLCCSGGQAIGLALHRADPTFGYDDWTAMRRPELFRVTIEEPLVTWDRTFANLAGLHVD